MSQCTVLTKHSVPDLSSCVGSLTDLNILTFEPRFTYLLLPVMMPQTRQFAPESTSWTSWIAQEEEGQVS